MNSLKRMATSTLFLLFSQLAWGQVQDPRDLLPPAVREFLNAEQGLISRSVNWMRLNIGRGNRQDPKYAPESAGVFRLRGYWIDRSRLHAFEGDGLAEPIKKVMFRVRDGQEQVLFFVHPESEDFYRAVTQGAETDESFYASATSSSRSLLVWREDVPPFIAKVSLNKEIGGIVRTIPLSEVSRSIGANNALSASSKTLPKNFEWMKETFGAIPKGMERGGLIIRQLPPWLLSGEFGLVSLFSLYGGDPERVMPLLVQMIRRSGERPSQFIVSRILEPFVEMWVQSVLDNGFSMEAHAQNTLLRLGYDRLPEGDYGFRDLGGFDFDFSYRDKLGFARPFLPYIQDFEREYHQTELKGALNSSLYNHFDGGFIYNLDRFIPKWVKKGWIENERLPSGYFSKTFRSILTEVLRRRGWVGKGEVDLSSIFKPVSKIRDHLIDCGLAWNGSH